MLRYKYEDVIVLVRLAFGPVSYLMLGNNMVDYAARLPANYIFNCNLKSSRLYPTQNIAIDRNTCVRKFYFLVVRIINTNNILIMSNAN